VPKHHPSLDLPPHLRLEWNSMEIIFVWRKVSEANVFGRSSARCGFDAVDTTE
jgi:hypothetical protein